MVLQFGTSENKICINGERLTAYLLGDALLHESESVAYLEASNLIFELNSNHQGKWNP